MVMEAVYLKAQQEEAEANKNRERTDWKEEERKKLLQQFGQ